MDVDGFIDKALKLIALEKEAEVEEGKNLRVFLKFIELVLNILGNIK
jgi:hypothetical protein